MRFEVKGIKKNNYTLSTLENYLRIIPDGEKWIYKGLTVEIDSTIDYFNSDVLIRWTDLEEGFNDKLIIHSLEEFNINFKLIS